MKTTSGPQLLPAGNSTSITIGIDFNDTLQPAKFDIWWVYLQQYTLTVGGNKKLDGIAVVYRVFLYMKQAIISHIAFPVLLVVKAFWMGSADLVSSLPVYIATMHKNGTVEWCQQPRHFVQCMIVLFDSWLIVVLPVHLWHGLLLTTHWWSAWSVLHCKVCVLLTICRAIWQTIGNVLHEYNSITQVGERGKVHECVGTEKIPAYTIVVAINTSLLSILHCHRYSTINI